MTRFLYVMDPMCGWCYAFQPELEEFLAHHPSAEVEWVMGGLAPDSTEPMDEGLRQTISGYWHEIEKRTRVTFNHDFWTRNTPVRSTYPACRAVISAERLKTGSTQAMVKAIQSAYYQEAKNPALKETLIACASAMGLDEKGFSDALESSETEQQFQQHLALTRHLRVRRFPALFRVNDSNQAQALALGYCPAADLEQRFNEVCGQG